MEKLRELNIYEKQFIDNYSGNVYTESLDVKIGFYSFQIYADFEPIIEIETIEEEHSFLWKKWTYTHHNKKFKGEYGLKRIWINCEFDYDFFNKFINDDLHHFSAAEDKLLYLKESHRFNLPFSRYIGIKDNKINYTMWDKFELPYKEELKQIITNYWDIN